MSHRYMVSVNDKMDHLLIDLSKKNKKSISGLIVELMNEALEYRDDYQLSKLAEEADRKAEGRPLITAEEVWRKCDLE